jgi:hypothetical protein
VLRAGSGEVVAETRALFRIGSVRDVYLAGGTLLAAAALGSAAEEAFVTGETVWLVGKDTGIERFDSQLATGAGDEAGAA